MGLTNWKVFLVKANLSETGDTVHFVGSADFWYSEGRVTSHIVDFDPKTKRGVSRSGRIYELVGESTHLSRDAEYVWSHWRRLNGFPEYEDITDQFE